MKAKGLTFFLLPFSFFLFTFILDLGWSLAWADDLPKNPTFSTLITTPLGIEGLTGDNAGNLYVGGQGGNPCPVWRINLANPSLVVVGNIEAPCAPLGIAFNDAGDLFVADGAAGRIYAFIPNAAAPPTATVFASGVPGTNGVAFDRDGNLWTGDGTTGRGRVWRIGPSGGVCEPSFTGCEEVFRIQPMRNGTALGGNISEIPNSADPTQGVGRQSRTFPHTAAGGNPQDLVANGLAFSRRGDDDNDDDNDDHNRRLFVADTARGAIWKVDFDRRGNLKSQTGCDTTFTANTLCVNNVFIAHPFLEGADGIALDKEGNIWVDANERNAVVLVTKMGKVIEVFRNDPDGTTQLRNEGPLEFPTSPFLSRKTLCTANFDGNRRDNFPNTAGEISPAADRGKISCMDQQLKKEGLPLPVR